LRAINGYRKLLLAVLPWDTIAIMEREPFEEKLRHLLRREPFHPFAVEMIDGRIIWVTTPSIAFDAGAATFISPSPDEWIEFACEDVRAFRPAVPGPPA
jgi:hypothetical protein